MRIKRLGEFAEIQTGPFGSQLHKDDYVLNGTPIVTVEHLGKRLFTEQNLPKVSDDDKQRLSKYILSEGDIVFSRVGSVDRCSYVDQTHDGWMFSGRCLRVRPDKSVLPLFLYYYFCLEETKQFVRNIAVGATMPSINTKLMSEVRVAIPEIESQQRIADILSSIDNKIELNETINENLLQQLSEIYRSWYVDFSAVSKGFASSEYGDIPSGWHYKQLGDVCQSISVTHKFDKEQLIFLNTGDIDNGQFLHSNYMPVKDMPGQAKKTICPDDILYSEIRPANKHFAYVNFPSADYVVSTKLMVIRSKGIDSRRLYHFLTMKETLTELQLQAESRSGTFPQIRFDNVSKLPILIADAVTENTFTGILHSVYRQIESNIAENYKLAQIRDSLLPKLMTGELDISKLDL